MLWYSAAKALSPSLEAGLGSPQQRHDTLLQQLISSPRGSLAAEALRSYEKSPRQSRGRQLAIALVKLMSGLSDDQGELS